MIKGWATLAIGLLAVLAIVGGLILTGGPGQARKERRDRQRENDLSNLSAMVTCLARENGNRLPKTIAPDPQCDWQVVLEDGFTGQSYRYQVTGPRSYRLCAEFELPPTGPRTRGARDDAGCISHDFVPMPTQTPGADP